MAHRSLLGAWGPTLSPHIRRRLGSLLYDWPHLTGALDVKSGDFWRTQKTLFSGHVQLGYYTGHWHTFLHPLFHEDPPLWERSFEMGGGRKKGIKKIQPKMRSRWFRATESLLLPTFTKLVMSYKYVKHAKNWFWGKKRVYGDVSECFQSIYCWKHRGGYLLNRSDEKKYINRSAAVTSIFYLPKMSKRVPFEQQTRGINGPAPKHPIIPQSIFWKTCTR